MSLADQIRDFACKHYVLPARNAGQHDVTIRAGDVHRDMRLANRYPLVCSSLGGPRFEHHCGIRLVGREGPAQGANVFLRFVLNPSGIDSSSEVRQRPPQAINEETGAIDQARDECSEIPPPPNETSISVTASWQPIGQITRTAEGKLIFPAVSTVPGLYRFDIRSPMGSSFYVGEAENLARRFSHYRSPGPTQQTNIRLNASINEALEANAEVAVAVVTDDAFLDLGTGSVRADLSSKAIRCLIENAALITIGSASAQALNLSLIPQRAASEALVPEQLYRQPPEQSASPVSSDIEVISYLRPNSGQGSPRLKPELPFFKGVLVVLAIGTIFLLAIFALLLRRKHGF